MSGFLLLLVVDTGEAADPGAFVSTEPPGRWKAGDRFWSSGHREFRILERLGPPKGDVPEAADWSGIFVVQPLSWHYR